MIARFTILYAVLSFSLLLAAGGTNAGKEALVRLPEQTIGSSAKLSDNELHLMFRIQNEQYEGEYTLLKTGEDGTLRIMDYRKTTPNQLNMPLLYWYRDASYPFVANNTREKVVLYELIRTREGADPELMATWRAEDVGPFADVQ